MTVSKAVPPGKRGHVQTGTSERWPVGTSVGVAAPQESGTPCCCQPRRDQRVRGEQDAELGGQGPRVQAVPGGSWGPASGDRNRLQGVRVGRGGSTSGAHAPAPPTSSWSRADAVTK